MFAPFDLTGKVALVTGGNAGIGLAMGDALAAAGADVVLWGTNPEKNTRAKATLERHGRRVLAQRVDIADEAAVTAAMADAVATMGRIDAVLANAGVGGGAKPMVDTSATDLRATVAINLEGSFFTAREAVRHMISRAEAGNPGGSVTLVGTVATESGLARFSPYTASKAALAGLMRSMVVEHSRHGIRVNLVQPGFIRTEMTEHMRARADVDQAIRARIPRREWGLPEDFGGIAVYLASDASRYQSGSIIPIDGGYLAG